MRSCWDLNKVARPTSRSFSLQNWKTLHRHWLEFSPSVNLHNVTETLWRWRWASWTCRDLTPLLTSPSAGVKTNSSSTTPTINKIRPADGAQPRLISVRRSQIFYSYNFSHLKTIRIGSYCKQDIMGDGQKQQKKRLFLSSQNINRILMCRWSDLLQWRAAQSPRWGSKENKDATQGHETTALTSSPWNLYCFISFSEWGTRGPPCSSGERRAGGDIILPDKVFLLKLPAAGSSASLYFTYCVHACT